MSISGKRQTNNATGNVVCLSKRHGTHHAYRRFHCRCPETMQFMARYQKERRERAKEKGPAVVDATVTHRQIRALLASGWTSAELSKRLGYERPWTVREFLESPRVLRTTAEKVEALYGALEAVPGPSRLNQMRSKHKGWAVPFAWDPETIADPDAEPDHGLRMVKGRTYEKKQMSAQETLFEYQYHKDLGLRHDDILKELGIEQSAYDKVVARNRAQG